MRATIAFACSPVPLSRISGALILLVEDNVFSQQVGKELLEDVNATVVVANNGREAIDLMLKQRFDCVLMDVQMPVMDGFEATRMIRADPRLRDTVVIAMTANAGKDDQARCLSAGMNEFITKPIAPNLMFDVIAKWLRLQPRSGRRRTAAPLANALTALVPRSTNPALLDMGALSRTFGANPDKMRKYALMFLDSARDGLTDVSEALAVGDLARMAELGHRIKSSAKAVGAVSFAELCMRLEGLRDQGPEEDGHAIVARMVALHAELSVHMVGELEGDGIQPEV